MKLGENILKPFSDLASKEKRVKRGLTYCHDEGGCPWYDWFTGAYPRSTQLDFDGFDFSLTDIEVNVVEFKCKHRFKRFYYINESKCLSKLHFIINYMKLIKSKMNL